MNVSSIIALFLGLVIQWTQLQAAFAFDPATSCGGHGVAMSCCDGLQSCPCVSEGEPDQKPSPLTLPAGDLKLLVSGVTGPSGVDELLSQSTEISVSATSGAAFVPGYAGVPLSVAFCRFVI